MNARQGTLLIVEDDRRNRAVLAARLEGQGYTVAMAENGRQALEMLRTQSFDLVLLDLMMPEMNGYQVIEHLKGTDRYYVCPLIPQTGRCW